MRKSTLFLGMIAGCLLTAGFLIGIYPLSVSAERLRDLEDGKELVRELGLTDLCLFTEARYTRHISQADLHSAFQDGPASMEHFPSGSLVLPPMLKDRAP